MPASKSINHNPFPTGIPSGGGLSPSPSILIGPERPPPEKGAGCADTVCSVLVSAPADAILMAADGFSRQAGTTASGR